MMTLRCAALVQGSGLLLGVLLAVGCARAQVAEPAAAGADHLWWEGEQPAETNFPATSWFSADTFAANAHLLSSGAWLSNSGQRQGPEAYAIYQLSIPRAATYQFWARKFWKHGPFRWRFGDGDWRVCGRDIALADSVELRTHTVANWVHLGEVTLPAGPIRFELRLLAEAGQELTAAFDCFLLIDGPFQPRGKSRPGERTGQAAEGWFAWEPPLDRFAETAELDLRGLNEPVAGQGGRVRREGGRFVLGDGRPVRFWAVNVGPNNVGQDRASIDYLARKLAKLGVNMVRYHGPIFAAGGDPAVVDRQRLDDIQYLVAALKRNGIYTKLSFYFPLWFDIKPEYGIPGFDTIDNKRPFALLYFEPRLQAIHRRWAEQLLTTPSPYAEEPLGRDPAVAVVEVINEDSFFFWTFTKRNVPAVHWAALEQRFGAWLVARHGSVSQAIAAWGGRPEEGDDPAAGRAAILEAWHMTAQGSRQGGEPKRRRMADQVRFLAEVQRDFYAATARYWREDLGYEGLVSASNWHVTDAATLDALERYTYTAGDVIDRHGYFGGEHKGDGASYSVRVGHTYQDRAGVRDPAALPLAFVQEADRPVIISEIGWPNPNRFRAESTALAGLYGALCDIDGFFFFAVGSNYLADTGMSKFAVSSPAVAAAMPAAALIYRLGLVREAEPVVEQVLHLDDLFELRGSGIVSATALDELRRRDLPPDGHLVGAISEIDPLAFFVGPVTRRLGDDPSASRQRDWAGLIDRQRRRVTSLTGELVWDHGAGLVTCDSPTAQGAVGFLAAGPVSLTDLTITSGNAFGSIFAVPLDGQPLASSRRILLQAMTEERPYGFAADGGTITALGAAPFNLRQVNATVRLRGGGGQVITLDENGQPVGTPRAVQPVDGWVSFPLAAEAVWQVLTR